MDVGSDPLDKERERETLMFSSVFCTPQFSAKRAKARTTNSGEIRHDAAAAAHDYDVEVSDCGEGKVCPGDECAPNRSD